MDSDKQLRMFSERTLRVGNLLIGKGWVLLSIKQMPNGITVSLVS